GMTIPGSGPGSGPAPGGSSHLRGRARSNVEVEGELVRVRPHANLGDLVGALPSDPRPQDVGAEDVTPDEELVVALERIECLLEATRRRRHVFELLGGHAVDVLVERLPRV